MVWDELHMTGTAAICLPRKLSCSPLLVGHPCPVPHFCDLSCTLLLLTYPAPKWVLLGPTWETYLEGSWQAVEASYDKSGLQDRGVPPKVGYRTAHQGLSCTQRLP